MKHLLLAVVAIVAMAACSHQQRKTDAGEVTDSVAKVDTIAFKQITLDTVDMLIDTADSMACSVHIRIAYADKPGCAVNDSILAAFTSEIYKPKKGTDVPTVVADFKKAFYYGYRSDCMPLFEEGMQCSALNYAAYIYAHIEQGGDSVRTYVMRSTYNLGGAHPSTIISTFSYNPFNGKILNLKDIVGQYDEKKLTQLIVNGVMKQFGAKTMDELKDKAIFDWTEPYVPGDVILGKDSAKFVYNQYDIAPYAVGIITVPVAYKDIK